MKKISLALLFSFLIQSSFAQFKLGAKGGLNFSNLVTDAGSFGNNIKESRKTKTGFALGVYARFGEKLFFQPELMFSSKGGKVNVTPLAGGTPVSLNLNSNNLELPLLVGYKFFKRIRVVVGPVASLKLNEDEKFADELKKITGNVDEAFAKSTIGYQAGIGFKLLGFDFDLRNVGSLGDISSKQFSNDAKYNQTQKGWQFTIGKKIL
jgi:hypothetical protein